MPNLVSMPHTVNISNMTASRMFSLRDTDFPIVAVSNCNCINQEYFLFSLDLADCASYRDPPDVPGSTAASRLLSGLPGGPLSRSTAHGEPRAGRHRPHNGQGKLPVAGCQPRAGGQQPCCQRADSAVRDDGPADTARAKASAAVPGDLRGGSGSST